MRYFKAIQKDISKWNAFFWNTDDGIEDNNILDELLSDLSFQPFSISIQKINITIHLIDIPEKQGVGCGFASSFIYRSKEPALFFYCQIIELTQSVNLLYPDDYNFSERKIHAWQAMLRATGCVNITPFDKRESEVGLFS
jgi:hypothetical protein